MSTLKQGLLLDPKITQKVFSGIEHGSLSKVDTLVIHQTGASTAQQTFNSYAKGGHGAHFLIDKKGQFTRLPESPKKPTMSAR